MASEHRRREPLSTAQEAALARRIDRGDAAAKEELVARNLGLVWSLAARYRGRGAAYEDLLQEGALGLVRAVERFDHRRGYKFSTYAVWWIRRALMDAVGDAQPIRMPPAARRQLAAVQRAQAELRRTRGGAPSEDEVAHSAGLSVRTLRALRAAPEVSASLDEPVADGTTVLGELVGDERSPAAFQRAETREASRELWSMLRLLPERQREVLLRRYGLRGDVAQSHEAIGAWLGVGEERSRQIERQALHWLRTMASAPRLAAA
jgi:RNA polymerase sigma factor (sigma-70 family)